MASDDMLQEFKLEAMEMFEDAEDGLLNIDKGEDFASNYNSIFRAFHSSKGAAGMFGLDELQEHMHNLESLFARTKEIGTITNEQIDYFLAGIDSAKKIIDNEPYEFTPVEESDFLSGNMVSRRTQSNKAPTSVVSENADTKLTDATASIRKAIENKERKRGPVVFVIDDEPDITSILSSFLGASGFTVYEFNDATQALLKADEIDPDVYLTDLEMPGVGGFDLINRLAKKDLSGSVIVVSAYVSKEVILCALEKGVTGFVEKPFDGMAIVETVKNAVKTAQSKKLLSKSINFMMYQFSDLDKYLADAGKEDVRQLLRSELEQIISLKNSIM